MFKNLQHERRKQILDVTKIDGNGMAVNDLLKLKRLYFNRYLISLVPVCILTEDEVNCFANSFDNFVFLGRC